MTARKKDNPEVVADDEGNVRVTYKGPFPVFLPYVSAVLDEKVDGADVPAGDINPGDTIRVAQDDAQGLLDQPTNWQPAKGN